MKVIMLKLDNPDNKYEWWIKDIEVKTSDDLVKLTGICGDHLYAEIYQIDDDDNPILVNYAKDCLSAMATRSTKDTIVRLFTAFEKEVK